MKSNLPMDRQTRLDNAGGEYTGWFARWNNFWFGAIDPVGFRVVRFLFGILLVAWLIGFAGHEHAFFGLDGWLDEQAYREISRQPELRASEPIGWSPLYLVGGNPTILRIFYWVSINILLLFALGVATRVTGVLTWLIVVSFVANPAVSFDVDYLLVIVAFYLAIGHLFQGMWNGERTVAEWILGPRSNWLLGGLFSRKQPGEVRPSVAANMTLRLLTIHFALIIVASFFHKMQIPEWWAGIAFWFPLHPPMETTREDVLRLVPNGPSYLFVLTLSQYLVLAWQFAFVFFAWRRGWWRLVLLGGSIIGWIGSAFVFREPLFGPVFFIASLCYLTPAEWRALGERVTRWRTRAPSTPHRAKIKVWAG